MSSRPARSRKSHRGGATEEEPVIATQTTWDELSEAERTVLKRMNRGPYPALPEAVGLRLIDLGLAVARPDGVGISRSGRKLVINTLLGAQQEDMDR